MSHLYIYLKLKNKNFTEYYAQAQRTARNYCRSCPNERTIRDDLPCIGHRSDSKFFYPVLDEKLQQVSLYLIFYL